MFKKYGKELNLNKDSECVMPRAKLHFNKNFRRYFKQRLTYGFDDRETWSLDTTSAIWLYEHIRMLEEVGGKIVDYECNYFFPKEITEEIENLGFPGIDSDAKVMHLICDLLKKGVHEEKGEEKTLSLAFRIYSIVLARFWW